MTGSPVQRAVIPIAGLGTRLFPASHAVKKELFPVVGPDGIARALVHYHLIALAAAGIESIALVVQPGEDALVRNYLRGPDADYRRRLAGSPALEREAADMAALADRLTFVTQATQDGYGHAVYQARHFAAGAPVLLCLGDHLFRGRSRSPYAEILTVAARHPDRALSAVNRIDEAALARFGTIAGTRRPGDPRVIEISRIVEKPDVATARAHLRVEGLPGEAWLGWFGLHVLPPEIFDVLGRMIRDEVRDRGEFQLTRAQERLREDRGYLAYEMTEAERFDFGTPAELVKSLSAFASA
jgi:UTP--glucose-1-phosphate uridylyltransferase